MTTAARSATATINGVLFVNPEELITTGQAAEISRYTQRGIQAAIQRGDLRAFRIGNRDLILREDLDNFLQRMKELGQGKYDVWARGKRTK